MKKLNIAIEDVIHGVALQPADFDGLFFLLVHHAGAFAEYFGGAHAAATVSEDIGFENHARGAAQIVRRDFLDERRDVNVRGASDGAGRVKAEKAARGFDGGLARGHARRDFREILFVLLGRKLGSRLAQRHGPAIVPLGWKRDAILTPAIAAHVNGFSDELRIGQRGAEPHALFVMMFNASPQTRENRLAGCIRQRSGILSASFRNHTRKFTIIRCMEKRLMRKPILWITALMIAVLALPLAVVHAQSKDDASAAKTEAAKTEQFKPEQQASKGSVTVGGTVINYDAFAGTLVVHPKDWDDVPQNAVKDDKSQPAEASMFYVAYFKTDSQGYAAAHNFSIQRRPRFFDGVAAHGSVWSAARGDGGRLAHASRAVPGGQ